MTKNILLLTKDEHLPSYIQKLGSILLITSPNEIITLLNEDNFDLIIIGPPFFEDDVNFIKHENIEFIKKPEDLKALYQKYLVQSKQEQVAKRKIRSSKPEIPYEEAQGTVLLVTTDANLIKEISCFNLIVSTNTYSVSRYLSDIVNEISLIIWDRNTVLTKLPKTNIPTYIWGEEVKNKKDIYFLLTTGNLSIESKL